ncbi:MAG: 2OG-Fe(II) oxygenase [Myxococcaceae bacterium]|nr:2OG-Fe(II) oxygenase [Myxococcaceae bacterium]
MVEPALPEAQFEELARRIRALGAERLRSSYQTTFWFDLREPPSNVVEEAAVRLFRALPGSRRRGVIGVEWWLSRMRTSNVKVDFHVDRDNALFDDTGHTVTPVTSSVLYLTSSVGGLLAVTKAKADPTRPACIPDTDEFELVEPRPNRFVYFDAKLTHGVLDARNQVPLARLPVQRRWRIGVAINFWHRRPRRVGTFAESAHYRRLATPAQSA